MLPDSHRQVAAPHNNALKLTAHGCVHVGCGAPQLSAVFDEHHCVMVRDGTVLNA
jgi:hypothetical protein